MKKKSKRFKALLEQKDKIKVDNLDSKIDLIKKTSTTKFVESIDLSYKVNNLRAN